MTIAAYVIPFNMGGVGQTQAQASLYDRIIDQVNEIEKENEGGLNNLHDKFGDNQKAKDRIDVAEESK